MPFKKIFKPVAKVLDKVIPNEIKPALPYLAAFAPVFGPPGLQSFIGDTMLRRALVSGGLNIGAQLAQEGNEGEINLISAGLGALSGAMTAPGAADKFQAMKFGERGSGFIQRSPMGPANIPYQSSFVDQSGITGLQKAANIGLEGLRRGSEFLAVDPNVGGTTANLFSKEGLKIAAAPAATATGDVMEAEARRLNKQAIIDQALGGLEEGFSNADASEAIRLAMLQYGFSDDEISETIAAAGYKVGGRVGYRFGGIDAALDKVKDEDIKESVKMVADIPDMDLMDLIEEFEITFKRKPVSMEELKQFYRENYEMESPIKLKEKIKEKVTMEAKDGGRVNFREGGVLAQILPRPSIANFQPFLGRPAFLPLQQPQAVFPRLNQLEQGVNRAEEDLGNIRERLGNELRQAVGISGQLGLQQTPAVNMLSIAQLANRGDVPQGMKEGGLMDLGGKEMDLRGGGFVPIGKKEKADDVPARLSKNEFVMTADAVRAAGGGSVNKGAKRMYNLMNTLEARA